MAALNHQAGRNEHQGTKNEKLSISPLLVFIQIYNNQINALIDSGSSVSLIEEKVTTGSITKNQTMVEMNTAGPEPNTFVSDKTCFQQFVMGELEMAEEFLVVENIGIKGISVIVG